MKLQSIILLSILFNTCKAQELPRRPFLGIRMEKATKENSGQEKGVFITTVIPNSSASLAGFKEKDVLLRLNGTEVNKPDEVMKEMTKYKSKDAFSFEGLRDKKPFTGTSLFTAYPVEKYPDIEMEYTAVKTGNGIQRLIISKLPGQEKKPAVVYLGGMGCYSLDTPTDTNRIETQLLNTLTRSGYVCIRAEKPGVGDNANCKPCNEISLTEEMEGYLSAVKKIKQYTYVDSSRIYIIGHSMGGVMAPLVAQKTTIKGIIAYGTIGSNFIEYLNKTRRTIGQAYEWKPEEIDDYVKDYCECAGFYFVENMTTAEATKKKESCRDYLTIFDYRARLYNKELYQLNIPGAWKGFAGKALLMWGESDYISAKEDHQILTESINYYHPGNASFLSVKASSHAMQLAPSFRLAKDSPGAYNPEVGKAILEWLKNS